MSLSDISFSGYAWEFLRRYKQQRANSAFWAGIFAYAADYGMIGVSPVLGLKRFADKKGNDPAPCAS